MILKGVGHMPSKTHIISKNKGKTVKFCPFQSKNYLKREERV
jgi:hypothetical protein